MSPEMELVLKYAVYPLIGVLFSLFMVMYKKDMNNLKESITTEKGDREKKLADTDKKVEGIYSILTDMNIHIAEIKTQLKNQEKICDLRHRWDGKERRV